VPKPGHQLGNGCSALARPGGTAAPEAVKMEPANARLFAGVGLAWAKLRAAQWVALR
jgi:hypothetical protein